MQEDGPPQPDNAMPRGVRADACVAGERPRYAIAPLSWLVVGCGVLILVSFGLPYFEPPFGGSSYMQWLSGGTTILGTVALQRREQGSVARVSLVVTLCAASLFVFTIVFPWAYGLAASAFMPN